MTPAEEAKLVARARAQGTTTAALVRQAIEPILTAVASSGRDLGEVLRTSRDQTKR